MMNKYSILMALNMLAAPIKDYWFLVHIHDLLTVLRLLRDNGIAWERDREHTGPLYASYRLEPGTFWETILYVDLTGIGESGSVLVIEKPKIPPLAFSESPELKHPIYWGKNWITRP